MSIEDAFREKKILVTRAAGFSGGDEHTRPELFQLVAGRAFLLPFRFPLVSSGKTG
jgi:hypothetical protein